MMGIHDGDTCIEADRIIAELKRELDEALTPIEMIVTHLDATQGRQALVLSDPIVAMLRHAARGGEEK